MDITMIKRQTRARKGASGCVASGVSPDVEGARLAARIPPERGCVPATSRSNVSSPTRPRISNPHDFAPPPERGALPRPQKSSLWTAAISRSNAAIPIGFRRSRVSNCPTRSWTAGGSGAPRRFRLQEAKCTLSRSIVAIPVRSRISTGTVASKLLNS